MMAAARKPADPKKDSKSNIFCIFRRQQEG